jgi:dinuclear metal center YbgI/SA1388 family protein
LEIGNMTTTLIELQHSLDELLTPSKFNDYCPNGLQVEGRSEVRLLVTGVTASLALIEEAVRLKADAILVHHGFFWKGESPIVKGMKRRRMAALLANELSLLAYHLPLDAHPSLGNNACLGRLMGFDEWVAVGAGGLVSVGELAEPITAKGMLQRLRALTGREPLHIGDATELVRKIAWCTGAAQGYIEEAVAAGADMYITGEASEQTVHVAREEGIHFVAAGHHATERYGVQAVGEHLAQAFNLEHRFVDIDNPV